MRRLLALVRLLAICLAPIAMALVPMTTLENARPVCLYTLATGMHCWGCGMTRALCAAVRGDYPAAFAHNPRVVIVLPLLFFVWVGAVRRESGFLAATKRKEAPVGASS